MPHYSRSLICWTALLMGACAGMCMVVMPREAAHAVEAVATTTKAATIELPSRAEVDEALREDAALTGRELYDRLLKNRRRLRTAYQEGRILSRDPAGNPQETRLWARWKDYRDADDKAVGGIVSKAIIKVSGPYELRHTGYLFIQRDGQPDEHFMYSPSRQRTTRVHIKGQNVVGTDFSIDDFLVTLDDIEDADYRRLPDALIDDAPCYVVEAVLKPSATARYTRSIGYLEKEHYVPLRTRYWDEVGVESKQLVSSRAAIKEFDGAWIPTVSMMTDLLEGTTSTLRIERLDPNPPLDDMAFALTGLQLTP